ncbi:AraC family transcriptional regulator [Vibrio fluvialis]|nr:AraC family transcriptional regulator [Vibrio fluvialis]
MTRPSLSFNRLCKLLDYIHAHLDQPLSLDDLAQQSCWSRWQLQRVFQSETGLTVANYVRELKLSEAAENLIGGSERVIDIALANGFSSEISFSRAFRQHFGLSPRDYRKLGRRTGLRKPLQTTQRPPQVSQAPQLMQLRVESAESETFYGLATPIRGLLAAEPDFAEQVPSLWAQFSPLIEHQATQPLTGVIDVTAASGNDHALIYWATSAHPVSGADRVTVPAQTYAVVKHRGPIALLPQTLAWFIFDWLPQSNYRGVDGFELERYPNDYDGTALNAEMEYWLPVEIA